jgi:hypothetical protein
MRASPLLALVAWGSVLLLAGLGQAAAAGNVSASVQDRWLVLTNPDGISTSERGRPRGHRRPTCARGLRDEHRLRAAGPPAGPAAPDCRPPPAATPPPAARRPRPPAAPAGWRRIEFLEKQLANDGLAFDVVVIDRTSAARPDLKAVLWNADGTGKYRGYFM